MSATGNHAVFLSYASQDAEAAKLICEALRLAGVEVWFDQSELVGGDAWDAKIRGQIASCALFVPIISANTQARLEGYFRIEWKLAAQRTHAMAEEKAFLLPLVIDDTRDGEAKVPAEFKAVQWTRVRLAQRQPVEEKALAAFVARVGKLLGDEVLEAGRPRPAQRDEGVASPVKPSRARAWIISTVAGLVVIGALALGQPWKEARVPAAPISASAAAAPKAAVFPRDPDLKRAMDLINGTEANTEDFALAEEIAKAAVTQRPMDAEAATVMARVQLAYLYRGFDGSDERRAVARRYAERAVQLASNDPEALAALGVYYNQRGADPDRSRELIDRAIALKPDDPFFHRHRDNALFNDPKVATADALASAERTAARFPGDALAQYELARRYRDTGRVADMERALDRSIALTPIANAVVWKARIALYVRGDVAEMKALIDRVPSRVRSTERVVFSRWAYAMVAGRPDEGLNALDSLTSKWIEDFDYVGPTALLAAQLLELQGKPELARLQYGAALAEVQARQARTPGDPVLRELDAWIKHGQGKDDEARALNRVALEGIPRPYRIGQLSDWWFTVIPACLLMGERTIAMQLIREAVAPATVSADDRRVWVVGLSPTAVPATTEGARTSLRVRFKFDPRMAPWRDDAEIAALLSGPEQKK